jgi:hypothetical protein
MDGKAFGKERRTRQAHQKCGELDEAMKFYKAFLAMTGRLTREENNLIPCTMAVIKFVGSLEADHGQSLFTNSPPTNGWH